MATTKVTLAVEVEIDVDQRQADGTMDAQFRYAFGHEPDAELDWASRIALAAMTAGLSELVESFSERVETAHGTADMELRAMRAEELVNQAIQAEG